MSSCCSLGWLLLAAQDTRAESRLSLWLWLPFVWPGENGVIQFYLHQALGAQLEADLVWLCSAGPWALPLLWSLTYLEVTEPCWVPSPKSTQALL